MHTHARESSVAPNESSLSKCRKIFSLVCIDYLPKDENQNIKILQTTKCSVTKKLTFGLGRVENILGKGENAGYQHFLLFPKCFQKALSSGSLTSGLYGKELKKTKMWPPKKSFLLFFQTGSTCLQKNY